MDPLLDPIKGAEHREVAGVATDLVTVGTVRLGRFVYPPGFRWSTHMKPLVGTELCQPAVLIHFDAETDTARRFGLPDQHRHS